MTWKNNNRAGTPRCRIGDWSDNYRRNDKPGKNLHGIAPLWPLPKG